MKWLKTDIGPKLLSVVIALSLWFYVVQVQSPDIEKTIKGVPVVFTQKNALEEKGLTLLNDKENTIDIKVKGRRKYLVDVESSTITVLADVSTLEEPGVHTVFTNVVLPPGNLEVINKNPTMMTVNVDYLTVEEKEVDIVSIGSPKQGFVVGNMTRNPASVNLKGPKSIMDGVHRIVAEVDVTGKEADVSTISNVKIYDSNNKEIITAYVSLDVTSIEVRCEILKTKTVRLVPTLDGEIKKNNIVYTPDSNNTKTIQVAGPSDIINDLSEVGTNSISSYDINENNEVIVELNLPNGIRSLDGDKFTLRFIEKNVE